MKFNVRRFVIILVSIMAGSFIIAGILFYFTGGISPVSVGSSQVRTSKSYEAAEVEKIVIRTIDTDIDVIPAVIKKIDIDFYGNIRTNLTGGKPELKTYLEDGILAIEITYPRTISLGLINLAQLKLDIYVPDDYSGEIMVDTASGDLDASSLDLESFDFQSASGDLLTDSVTAQEFKVETASGEVKIDNFTGALGIDTISGDVTASLKEFNDDLKVKTISGEVQIDLPEESEFIFDLSSVSGNIANEFGAKISFSDRGNIEGTVGEGAFTITVESTSGDINLIKGGK